LLGIRRALVVVVDRPNEDGGGRTRLAQCVRNNRYSTLWLCPRRVRYASKRPTPICSPSTDLRAVPCSGALALADDRADSGRFHVCCVEPPRPRADRRCRDVRRVFDLAL